MKKLFATSAVLVVVLTIVSYSAEINVTRHEPALEPTSQTPGRQAGAPAPAAINRPAATSASPNVVVETYCSGCHNEDTPSGGLSLEAFDANTAHQKAEIAEKMIRKLRAGMMPPPDAPRPGEDVLLSLVETLEKVVDDYARTNPNPGARVFQRLNRPEYQRAIKDLLTLNVDAGDWLPLDTMSNNFDNNADAQALSPMLLESYLNAASAIARMAIGDRNAPQIDETYTNSQYVSQHPWDHVEGAPYGTRGGIVADHVFPADAEYVFQLTFASGDNTRVEDIDISIDGERVALLLFDTNAPGAGADGRGSTPLKTQPILVKAGQRKVAAAFIRRTEGPYEDLIRPHEWSYANGGSGGPGITTLPHIRDIIVSGPYNITGLSDTPSRKKIFTCRPTSASEERPCAREIITRLASEAYRRAASPAEIDGLMAFYDRGAKKDGFEIGVRTALEGILASPYFVLRLEKEPSNVKPGESYRISDLDLATRLSFFLWGTPPDQELQTIASQGRLSAPGELERQTRRMLADPRSEALGTRFAYQWFRLQDLYKVRPDPNFFPNFDENMAQLMQRETETFFNNLVRENRSVTELFNADYTFVNERLARHYGIPNVAGVHFRRVTYPDDTRRGLLGHGSMLVLTSFANRTSPVLRGKWIMEVLMGTPPPPPPPDVNTDLEAVQQSEGGKLFTTRKRLELHRANPTCNACHRFMDPIGMALDNFDVIAKWRNRENGIALDTRGDFYDGTPISTPAELAAALQKRPIPLVRNLTENLMAYALGRRVEYYDQPTIRKIASEAKANEYRISSFILGVVKSDAFQMKRAEQPASAEARAAEPR